MGTQIVKSMAMDDLLKELLDCKIIVNNTNLMNPFTFIYFLTLIRERIKKESGIEGKNSLAVNKIHGNPGLLSRIND